MNNKKIKFSIPFNGDLALVKWALKSNQVYEVYFSGPDLMDFSDPYENNNNIELEKVINLIKLCNKEGVETNLLINKGTHYFDNLKKIKFLINSLRLNGGKIDYITIADVYLVDYLAKEFPDIKLQSSIYMGLDTVAKVSEAIKMGLKSFCLDPNINRNYKELKKISSLKKKYPEIKIKILGIIQCYSNCFFSSQHNEIPVLANIMNDKSFKHKGKLGLKIDPYKCTYKVNNFSDEVKRNIVRPEDVFYYEKNKLVDYIKIAFRNDSSDFLKEKYFAYFNRKYKGSLFKFIGLNNFKNFLFNNNLFPKDFIDKVMKCDKNCDYCSYCDKIANKTITKIK